MKIGIISDTHGSRDDFEKIAEHLGDVDMYIHLGDVIYHGPRNELFNSYSPKSLASLISGMDNIIFVKGNCDSDVDEMVTGKDLSREYRIVCYDGVTMLLTHGYMRSVEEYVRLAKNFGADVLLYGHTHVKRDELVDGVRVINPGSVSLPKDGTKSALKFEDGKFIFVEI